jgi:hypothetical protein
MGDWEYYWRGMRLAWEWTFPEKYPGLVGLAYDWQTLISGFLALLAGGIVYYQTRVQKKQFEEERRDREVSERRRERAARIRIPHALADLSKFVEEGFVHWVKGNLLEHQLDPGPVETLKQVSEFIDDDSYDSVRELVNAIQVFQSRHLQAGSKFLPGQAGIDLADLKYQIDRLYGFGRKVTNDPVPYVKADHEVITKILREQKLPLMQVTNGSPQVKTLVDQAILITPKG